MRGARLKPLPENVVSVRALSLRLLSLGVLWGLASCDAKTVLDSSSSPSLEYGLGGKADGVNAWAVPPTENQAPDWLLSSAGQGTWDATEAGSRWQSVRGWVDARVQNRRFQKRVFVETAAPYPTGVIRTLLPAAFRGTLPNGYERWGTDAVEIYPDGGPNDAALSGPVLYRLRMQADPDEDGHDQMIVTGWLPLYGDGAPVAITHDPWMPGFDSPVRVQDAPALVPQVFFPPFDDAGQRVVSEIHRITDRARHATPGERHTLHAAIFNINDPRITDAIIEARDAGVEVRLITEATKLRPWRTYQTEYDRLLAANIPLLAVRRPERAAMHDKIALFDGERVATGSFNWEPGSSHENHENMLLLAQPELLEAYSARFEVLAGMVQAPRQFAQDPSAQWSVSFAPDEAPYRITGALIDSAQRRIRVAMFTAKDVEYEENGQTTSLFRKLGEAAARGVEVSLMTDYGIAEAAEYYGVMSEDDPQDEWLASLGVHVVLADNPFGPYASMHHKFMVIDDVLLVTGAMNWYYDAAYLNDEDQLVARSDELAAEYTGELCDLMHRYDSSWEAAAWAPVALTVTTLFADTQVGDVVVVVGDLPELGAWDPAQGLVLDGSGWPTWRGSLDLPAGLRAQYKLVVRRADGTLVWQPGPNRGLRVPTGSDNATLTLGW